MQLKIIYKSKILKTNKTLLVYISYFYSFIKSIVMNYPMEYKGKFTNHVSIKT